MLSNAIFVTLIFVCIVKRAGMRATRASFKIRFSSNLVLSIIVFSVFTEFQVINNQRSKTLEVSVYKTFLRCGIGLC